MNHQRTTRDDLLVAAVACAVSVLAFVHYFRTGQVLLYGDAVAHINIARRVFDSRTPGLEQLGTVWLPLPHLLMLPLVISDWSWRTGLGGSIPSMVSYVLGVLGVFRLVSRNLAPISPDTNLHRYAAAFAAFIYGANPNLIYMQVTAMTESLYLALFVWATVFFTDFLRQLDLEAYRAGRSLLFCGFCLMGAQLTRYDGWFASGIYGAAALLVVVLKRRAGQAIALKPLIIFLVVIAAAPLAWMAWNASIFGNPLEFATGPYSARGIAERTANPSFPHHPGFHAPLLARLYFLKSAKLNLAEGRWEIPWVVFTAAGVLSSLFFAARRLWPWLLLWTPIAFYMLSIAYGGVPIFMPVWYPFSYYNVRYGLQLLPGIAMFLAAALFFGLRGLRGTRARILLALIMLVGVGGSYLRLWRTVPICLREARVNSSTRIPFEQKLAVALKGLPRAATILMYTGDHGGALQRADVPLRRTINESNWGEWQLSSRSPFPLADYVVAMDGDPVAEIAKRNRAWLTPIARVASPGQAPATVYHVRK